MAREQADAVWSDAREAPKHGLGAVGMAMGEFGPKAEVTGRLRELSLRDRRQRSEVPRGTTVPGTGRYVLGAMALIVLVLLALIVLLLWWAAG